MILLHGSDERGESGLQVLMVQRSKDTRIWPGFWVFPGGVVEDADHKSTSVDARYRNTALRELAEETNVELDGPNSLVPFARWITPAELGVRFDARFYIAPIPADARPEPDGEEIVEIGRFKPQDALERQRAGEMQMIFPTIKQLEDLARFSTAEEVIQDAPARSMEPVRPRAIAVGEKIRIVLPGEPGYND